MKGIAGATPHRQQNQVQGFVSTRGSGGRRPRNQEQKEGEAESTEEGSGDRAFTKGGRNRGNNRRGERKRGDRETERKRRKRTAEGRCCGTRGSWHEDDPRHTDDCTDGIPRGALSRYRGVHP